jgi:predicted methyltransferase
MPLKEHPLTKNEIQVAQRVAIYILESIEMASDTGAPSGVIYAALQTQGCTLSQYQSLMKPMLSLGYIKEQAHSLTITQQGREFMTILRTSIEKLAGADSRCASNV